MSDSGISRLKMMKLSAIAIFGAMTLVMVFVIGLS